MSESLEPLSKPVGVNAPPVADAMKDLTRLLEEAGDGGTAVRSELYHAVYGELRAIAARKMASERPGHTLQPTALVHEAWLRLYQLISLAAGEAGTG